MSSKGCASLIRSRRVGYVLAGLVLVLIVGCFDSADDGPRPVPDSSASTTVVEPIETAIEAAGPEGDTTTLPNRESSERVSTSAERGTSDDIEDGVDGAVAPRNPGAEDVVRTPPPDPDEGEPPNTVRRPEPDIDTTASQPWVGAPGPANNVLLTGSYRPDIDVRFEDGEVRALVTGTIGFRRRQVYAVEAAEGQLFTAVLDAKPGIWLDVRLGDDVIISESEQEQRAEATLPTGGGWQVSVVSSDGELADYALTVRLLTPEPDPVPPTRVSDPIRRAIEPGNVVYLTFDDGPHPANTPLVLDTLARHGARATFFVLGSLVERYPDLFQRIVSEGHTVANHTWNHENLAHLSREEFDETISRTQEILGDHATPCLRPPYAATGSRTREWAADHGLEVYLWTVSANDWLGLDAEAIADRIVGQVTDGSIVLMHDGGGNRTQTVRGLELVLDRLSGQGLQYEPLCR